MEDMLFNVKEVAEILKTNPAFVYELIKKGFLPALKLRSLKVRKIALLDFLQKYEGKDFTDINNVKDLTLNNIEDYKEKDVIDDINNKKIK